MKRKKLIEIPGLHDLTIRDFDALCALAEGE
jgi:hypothetical protein